MPAILAVPFAHLGIRPQVRRLVEITGTRRYLSFVEPAGDLFPLQSIPDVAQRDQASP